VLVLLFAMGFYQLVIRGLDPRIHAEDRRVQTSRQVRSHRTTTWITGS
jgi:hypothetical protein